MDDLIREKEENGEKREEKNGDRKIEEKKKKGNGDLRIGIIEDDGGEGEEEDRGGDEIKEKVKDMMGNWNLGELSEGEEWKGIKNERKEDNDRSRSEEKNSIDEEEKRL